MRKDIFLPVLALAGGAVGFLLRLWQYASAYDPSTELFAHGAPASLALVVWTVLMGALALLLGRGGTAAEKPEQSFLCPSTGYMTVMTAGGMCFLLSAAAGVPELMYQYQAWQIDPQHNMLPVAFGLSVLFCLVGSIGALVSGRNNYRGVTGLQVRAPAALPAYAALPWLMGAAAGAMACTVARQLIPAALDEGGRGTAGLALGFGGMFALSALLG